MNKHANDEDVLRQIRDQIDAERLAKKLFLTYKSYFKKFVISEGCPPNLALELYIKAFEIFYRKAKKDEITTPLKSNIQTFLNGIGKNLLKQTYTQSQKNKTESLQDLIGVLIDDSSYDMYQQKDNEEKVNKILNALGDKCKQLLSLTYLKDYSDDAIMREMEFTNEGAVRQQRLRCIKKCREIFNI